MHGRIAVTWGPTGNFGEGAEIQVNGIAILTNFVKAFCLLSSSVDLFNLLNSPLRCVLLSCFTNHRSEALSSISGCF